MSIARVGDTVTSKTGSGSGCSNPIVGLTITEGNSSNVFVNGSLAVVAGNTVPVHTRSGCGGPDISVLTKFSSSVLIGGKGVGRLGDEYTSDNYITSGSTNVIAG